ncbi:PUA-like domain-containing protein [Nemania sp. NC0429]|nr:PUA-like domain-containing protein [Nemania sp. NC0429]
MPKRKVAQLETETETSPALPRRSTRRKPPTSAAPDAAANENAGRSSAAPKPTPSKDAKTQPKPKTRDLKSDKSKHTTAKAAARSTATKSGVVKSPETDGDDDEPKSSDRWYWLLKAEPVSRFENGVDVKFSIDDLASRKDPEPWDGIRAYAARNNLRSMKKGELAFFYHSNCKEPGLVGTMEIVQEHSPDLSAHDPKAPYYDPSSKPEDPKWSVVHVEFRSKFARPIGLKELREMGKPGQPLENMQMLKQSRLSVSRVSPSEWEYLIDIAQRQDDDESSSTSI